MRIVLMLFLAGCSCAHTSERKITFQDDSDNDKTGWVCVPKTPKEWLCVSIETFQKYLRDAEKADM